MIGILDQIDVDASNLAALNELFSARYVPSANERGMTLSRRWISPPLALASGPNTLWLLWQLADVAAVWAMRFRAGADPLIPAFWSAVDGLCVRRQRHYLVDDTAIATLPAPQIEIPRTETACGVRETNQVFLKDSLDAALVHRWQLAVRGVADHADGVLAVNVSRNLEGSFLAGDFTVDIRCRDAQILEALRNHPYWREMVAPLQSAIVARENRITLQLISGGLRQPNITQAIKRTAYFRLLPTASIESIRRWERDILDMPAYMAGMTNWALSRSGDSNWSYVWEQEYARLDDLQGEYMMHPHHWSHVDPWFDPEFSRQIIDTQLVHAFCVAPTSILTGTLLSR